MDVHAFTIEVVRDGRVCTLILSGELDGPSVSGFLTRAALAIDGQTERLVLDLAAVTFLDCAGVRALCIAMSFAPRGCPVIIRALSPAVRRILELLDQDLEESSRLSGDHERPRPGESGKRGELRGDLVSGRRPPRPAAR